MYCFSKSFGGGGGGGGHGGGGGGHGGGGGGLSWLFYCFTTFKIGFVYKIHFIAGLSAKS